MTIKLRNQLIRGSTANNYRANPMPLTRYPETPRYCASCGCRLRQTNRARICDPCDTKARAAHDKTQAWLQERGLL